MKRIYQLFAMCNNVPLFILLLMYGLASKRHTLFVNAVKYCFRYLWKKFTDNFVTNPN